MEAYQEYSDTLDQLEKRKRGKMVSIGLLIILGLDVWCVWGFLGLIKVMRTLKFICGIVELILSIIIFIGASRAIKINWQQVDNYLERSKLLLASMQDPIDDMIQADEWREEREILCKIKIGAIANIIIVFAIAYHFWNTAHPF